MPGVIQRVETRIDKRAPIVGVLRQPGVADYHVSRPPRSARYHFNSAHLDIDRSGGACRHSSTERPVDQAVVATPKNGAFGVPPADDAGSTEHERVSGRAPEIWVSTKQPGRGTRVE